MKRALMIVAVVGLAACDRGENYESSGAVVDTVADTSAHLGLPDIDVGTTKDTVTVPTFGTQKDTVIVDKPVIAGKKKVEVTRPTVDVKKP